ncbi:hypothetical protein EVAR_90516_1 [Eumeta japonica]|uniref:Uncharacterized protein n=1 Tax=Eumeta variegata TaxID=151549 RepID=A0A4C1XUL9_EUMVA|nr:hypothetical protein EVAR_90516_1 [Eumeta japonica]
MATPRAREPAGRKPRASGERELHNSNSVFSGLSSDIQNDLIKSIAQVIRDEIKSEINFAKFVSVIADETPDISHREQMSVIFRYLTKTGIEERFVGYGGRITDTCLVEQCDFISCLQPRMYVMADRGSSMLNSIYGKSAASTASKCNNWGKTVLN